MSHLPSTFNRRFYCTSAETNECKSKINLIMLGTLKKIFKNIFYFWISPYRKGDWQYIVSSNLGLFVRGIIFPLLVPNIFEKITNHFLVQWNIPTWLFVVITMVISIIADRFITVLVRKISYWSVGNSYKPYSNPALGSILYTLYYAIYTLMPLAILYYFNCICVIICAAGYFFIAQVFYVICENNCTLPDNFKFRLIVHILLYLIITGVMLYLVISFPNLF